MAAYASDKPVLLIKKFGAVAALIIGLMLTATGLSNDYRGLTIVGGLLLVAGVILLAFKIVSRNQDAR
jgi:hypothetical protein